MLQIGKLLLQGLRSFSWTGKLKRYCLNVCHCSLYSFDILFYCNFDRPEVIDPALLRPGRFGKLVYVPLPSADERGMILKALARNKPIDVSVDLMAIGRDRACENLSGADLSALVYISFLPFLVLI